ncbi:MAG: DUF1794 domain-containing protein [Nitriliruptorales bacterium]|nr:DUF1794 domain-containing protein [Nitriliruptorales bacterium]
MNVPSVPPPAGLSFLLGTWAGEGVGEYPTIETFRYGEEIRVWHTGKPFLAYSQRTWALDDGRPLHSEVGYWRATPDGGVELVLAHPTGVVEVQEGEVAGQAVRLRSTSIATTATAKHVVALERDVDVVGEQLRYAVRMAAVGVPLTHHLAATLRRQPE